MCIRDSCGLAARHQNTVRADFFVNVAFASASRAKLAKVVVCLLYTSDAADERSSVDLGGRRIIKKKKRL